MLGTTTVAWTMVASATEACPTIRSTNTAPTMVHPKTMHARFGYKFADKRVGDEETRGCIQIGMHSGIQCWRLYTDLDTNVDTCDLRGIGHFASHGSAPWVRATAMGGTSTGMGYAMGGGVDRDGWGWEDFA